jgi:acetylornithine deacetylase
MGILPGMSCADMKKKIAAVVDKACQRDPWLTQNPPRVAFRGFNAEPCVVDMQSDFAQTLIAAHKELSGVEPAPLFATCTTDVRFFNLYAGIPATCYGPKAVNIHGADERVSLDSMEKTAMVIARFIETWCGVSKRS